jgi:hypothetical protein
MHYCSVLYCSHLTLSPTRLLTTPPVVSQHSRREDSQHNDPRPNLMAPRAHESCLVTIC